MAWQTPKQNWTAADGVTMDDMNRIEGNNQANKDSIDAHKSDNATSAHKDKNITVVDANNHFTGTTLDVVLDELFTFADNGRKGIVSVVGSPATNSDPFDTLKSRIQTIKNTLATNLTNKGQGSAGTETLAALVAKVANINTGKKWASGGPVTPGSLDTFYALNDYALNRYTIHVTGLTFKPSIVIIYANGGSESLSQYMTVYSEFEEQIYPKEVKMGAYVTSDSSGYTYLMKGDKGAASVIDGSFNLPIYVKTIPHYWIAIE